MSVDVVNGLFPHQAAFYEAFLARTAPANQLLIAPPGLGKGQVAQSIIHRVASGDPDARVLVLTPASLSEQYIAKLTAVDSRFTVVRVDRRRLREMLTAAANDLGLWPAPAVAVMSIDFAKQDDVAALLAKTTWDLVVVDEAHTVGGRRERLLRELSESTSRLLLLAGFEEATDLAEVIAELKIVRWNRDVVDSTGRRIFVPTARATHVVEYSRTDDEVAFVRNVLDFMNRATESDDVPQARLVRTVMTRALTSSAFAVELMLLRLRERLSDATYLELGSGSGLTEESDSQDLDLPNTRVWRDPEAAALAVDGLLARLEASPVDSKGERFRLLLHELGGEQGEPVCVFSSFASTIDYLVEIAIEAGQAARAVVGRMTSSEREEAITDFRNHGGLLALTDGVAQGLDLALAHHVIHYDLPESRLRMEQRWGRLDRVGQKETVHGYVLRDSRRSIEAAEQLLHDQGFIE
jgi:superfamily II DNA or RNA helicase